MIRDAAPADGPALRALQALLPEPAPAALTAALNGMGILLVSVDVGDESVPVRGVPVGYVVAFPGDDRAYVAELVVAEDYRREGRARALLESLFERLRERGVETVTLAVAPTNEGARALYRELGFRIVDRDPDYYDSGPALLLAKSL